MRRGLFAAACGALSLFAATPSRASLVANWTFDAGNASGLVDSVSGYTLAPRNAGSSPSLTYNTDGTVSLSGGQQLYTAAINSTALPNLQKNATIYLRIRFDGTPGASGAFASFTDTDTTLATLYSNTAGAGTALSGFTASATTAATWGRTDQNNGIAPSSGLPAVVSNQFLQIAIVFNDLSDQSGNSSATKSSATMYVINNGVTSTATREAAGTMMAAFKAFALGRTTTNGSAGAITLDQVQIYDEALTAAQVAAIPEPASLAGLALAGGAMLRRRRRA